MAEQWIEIGHVEDIPDNSMKSFEVGEKEILIAKVDGNFYALSNKCPHMSARLSAGTLEGFVVTCPRHGSQFDVRTGEVLRWTNMTGLGARVAGLVKPGRSADTYQVEVRESKLYLKL